MGDCLRLLWSRIRFFVLLLGLINFSTAHDVRGGEVEERETLYPERVSALAADLAAVESHIESPRRTPPTGWDVVERMGELPSDERTLPNVKLATGKSIQNVIESVKPLASDSAVADFKQSLKDTQVPVPRIADSMAAIGTQGGRVGKSSQDSFGAIAKKDSGLKEEKPEDDRVELEKIMREMAEKPLAEMQFEDYEMLKKILSTSFEDVTALLQKVPGFSDAIEVLYAKWAGKDASGEAPSTQVKIEQIVRVQPSKQGQIHQGRSRPTDEKGTHR